MSNESRVMREIHEIRELLSEEIRRMPPEEHTARVNREAAKLARKYGFTLVDLAKEQQRS